MRRFLLNLTLASGCLFFCFTNIVNAYGQDKSIDSLHNAVKALGGKEKLEAYNRELIPQIYSIFDINYKFMVVNEFIDEARKQKNIEYEALARYWMMEFLRMELDAEQFEKSYPDFMDFTKKNMLWEDFFYVFEMKISILSNQRKYEEALIEAEKLLSFAKELNNPFGLAILHKCFGDIYQSIKRFDMAEENYRKAIHFYKEAENISGERNGYQELLRVLKAQGKYKEMEKLLPEIENVRQQFIKELGFDELSTRLVFQCLYIDVYTSIEQYEKAQMYADSIREYIELLHEGYQADFQIRLFDLYKSQKKFSQALAVMENMYEYYEKIGHQYNMLESLNGQVLLLMKLNDGDKAAEKFEQYLEMRNAIEIEEINAKLDEIRTQYEVEKLIAEKNLNLNYFLFTLGGCILLAIALGIWISRHRAIVRKNRDLYHKIKEQDRLAEELEAVSKQYEQMAQLVPSAVETGHALSLPGNNQQRQLVSHLREYLLKERYFANCDIDIQDLIPEMATNRTSLFEALKAVTGKTPMEFINDLRLDEAKRLLDHSGLTIETIAVECGFNTSRTFYRQFRKRYGISPMEYRRMRNDDAVIFKL